MTSNQTTELVISQVPPQPNSDRYYVDVRQASNRTSAATASIRTLGNPLLGKRGVHDAEYADQRSQGLVQSPTGRGRELVEEDDDRQDDGPANAGHADQD